MFYYAQYIWKLTIIFLWFIGYITKFALIKELTFILLIIFLAMYSIEKDLFFIKKTEIEEYILYSFIITNMLMIIVLFIIFFFKHFQFIYFTNEIILNEMINRIRRFIIIFPIISIFFFLNKKKKADKYEKYVNTKFFRRAEKLFDNDPIMFFWFKKGNVIVEYSYIAFFLYLTLEKYILKISFPIFIKLSVSLFIGLITIYLILVLLYGFYKYRKIWKRNKKYFI